MDRSFRESSSREKCTESRVAGQFQASVNLELLHAQPQRVFADVSFSRRRRLRGVCRSDRSRTCRRCASALYLPCQAYLTHLFILCHWRCCRTCRRARTHHERHKRWTTSPVRRYDLPKCQAEIPSGKTKNEFSRGRRAINFGQEDFDAIAVHLKAAGGRGHRCWCRQSQEEQQQKAKKNADS